MFIKTTTTRSILNIAPLKTYYCLIILCLFSFSSFGQENRWEPCFLCTSYWDNVANWSLGVRPTADHDVIISGTRFPRIEEFFADEAAKAKSITIESGCGLIIRSDAKLTVDNNIINNGSLTVTTFYGLTEPGELEVKGNITNTGTFTVEDNSRASITGTVTNTGTFTIDDSTLNVTNNVTNNGTFTAEEESEATITGSFTNLGTLSVTSDAETTIIGTLINNWGGGDVSVNNATLNLNNNFYNYEGSLYLNNNASITIDQSLITSYNRSVTGISNSTLLVKQNIENNSPLYINNSEVTVNRTITNTNVLNVTNDSEVTVQENLNNSGGTVVIDDSDVSINKTLSNNNSLTIKDNSNLTVLENLNNTGGQMSVDNSDISVNDNIYISNVSTVSEATINGGSLEISSSGGNWDMTQSNLFIDGLINVWSTFKTGVQSHVTANAVNLNNSNSSWVIDETVVEVETDFFSAGNVDVVNGSNVKTQNLELSDNGTNWELNDTSILTVEETIDLKNSITLNDNASLIQTSTSDLNYYQNDYWSGALNVNRTAKSIRNIDYIYWSTPVEYKEVSTLNNSTDRYIWYPTNVQPGYASNFGKWVNATGEMKPGIGYIAKGGGSGHISGEEYTVTFTAKITEGHDGQRFYKINNGTIPVEVKHGGYNDGAYYGPSSETQVTNDDDNWNLLGNPYPSAISAAAFLTHNSNLAGNVRIWTHTSGLSSDYDDPFYANESASYNSADYITYNLSGSSSGPGDTENGFKGYIASCQGFFVLLNHSAPTTDQVEFTNAMRGTSASDDFIYNNEEFYRTDNTKHRIWLKLTHNKTKNAIPMLIGYINGATNEKDRLFDASNMDPNTTSFYSLIDNEGFVIQGKSNPFTNTDTVPLGVIIKEKDVYSIGISAVDGLFETTNQDIYLKDLYENKVHDLRAAPYQFSSEIGTFNDRFVLVYEANKLGIDETTTLNDLNIFTTKNHIKVSSKTDVIDSVTIYDILGRTLFNAKNLNTQEVLLDQFAPTNSPLIIKATLANGKTKTQKVIY